MKNVKTVTTDHREVIENRNNIRNFFREQSEKVLNRLKDRKIKIDSIKKCEHFHQVANHISHFLNKETFLLLVEEVNEKNEKVLVDKCLHFSMRSNKNDIELFNKLINERIERRRLDQEQQLDQE